MHDDLPAVGRVAKTAGLVDRFIEAQSADERLLAGGSDLTADIEALLAVAGHDDAHVGNGELSAVAQA
jgi:hypothetical protein